MLWQYEDILLEIFGHLDAAFQPKKYDSERDNAKVYDQRCKALFNIALTSKDFLQPALDLLWTRMDKFIPLLKLFPGFTLDGDKYILQGTITDEHWAHFDQYARRIKSFQLTRSNIEAKIHDQVFHRLLGFFQKPLFPKLRQFLYVADFNFLEEPPDLRMSLFLTPSLQSIMWELCGQDATPGSLRYVDISKQNDLLIRSFFDTLSQYGASTNLQEIGLDGRDLSRETLNLIPRISPTLCTLSLRNAINVDSGVVIQIGELPNLRNLTIDISWVGSIWNLEIGLKSLQKLILTGPMTSIQGFLSTIQSTHLDKIDFTSILTPGGDSHEILSCIITRWSRTLRSFSMNSFCEAYIEAELAPNDILSLSQLSLTEFTLAGFQISISDAEINILARAWPDLENLSIVDDTVEPNITVSSLHTLAHYCPRLLNLLLPVKDTVVPVPSNRLSFVHPLRYFSFRKVNLEYDVRESIRLVDHLRYLFPHLVEIKDYYGRGQGELMDLMNLVSQVRSDTLAKCKRALEEEESRGRCQI